MYVPFISFNLRGGGGGGNQADDSFCEGPVLNETPAVFDIATPKLSDSVTGENCMTSLGVYNDNCDVSCNIKEILNCTDISSDQDGTQVLNVLKT